MTYKQYKRRPQMSAYLKYILEFCNKILLCNTSYLFLLSVKGWTPLRKSPLQDKIGTIDITKY